MAEEMKVFYHIETEDGTTVVQTLGDDPKYHLGEKILDVYKFEAFCSCHAGQIFRKRMGYKPYDMYFCKEDKATGNPDLCPHFEDQLKELEKMKSCDDS